MYYLFSETIQFVLTFGTYWYFSVMIWMALKLFYLSLLLSYCGVFSFTFFLYVFWCYVITYLLNMESQNMSQNTVQCKSWDGGTRRTWTFNEEHCLINHFKDLVSQWWKCDNGFKSRCLAQLEQAMAKLFMGTNIKGEPQIHSKNHIWNKYYRLLINKMLSKSGWRTNESFSTIEVPSDELRVVYIKVNS